MKEKSINIKRIYTICFLGTMLALGLASIWVYINNHSLTNTPNKTSTFKTDTVSFSQLYPFDEAEDISVLNDQHNSDYVKKCLDSFNYLTIGTEVYFTTLNPLNTQITGLKDTLADPLDAEVVFNGANSFIKLPNGYLTGLFDYCASPESQEHILDFSTWLKDQGIPFVALIQPDKSDDSETSFPEKVSSGYSKMVEEYKAYLDEKGIKYIDAKPVLLDENDDLCSWFYKSDHHWNVHAAYEMAGETARVLNDELSIPADARALDDENFELVTYPNSFLGSYGKKLGDKWKEDMEVYYPNKDTNFHIEIPGDGIDKTGEFEDTLINKRSLKDGNTSYGAFLYGDRPLIRIKNNNCKNGTRVLVIKQSFADSMCPYLASTVQYLDVIDPRHFDDSIRSFITQTKPDAVILCMGVPTEDDEKYLQLK